MSTFALSSYGLDLPTILMVMAAVFLSAVQRGFTGFGFSITAVPMLSLLIAPRDAVETCLLLQVLVSFNGLGAAWRDCDWPSMRVLLAGAVIGTPIGSLALVALPTQSVRVAIACIVAGAVAMLGFGFRLNMAPRLATLLPVGLTSGVLNGLASMPGPPVIALYLAAPIAPAKARAAMIVFFLFNAAAALMILAAMGLVAVSVLVYGVLSLPAVWFGSSLGAVLYERCSEAHFRAVSLAVLGLTAFVALLQVALTL